MMLLKKEDKIAVFCGSRMVFEKDIDTFFDAIKKFNEMGLEVEYDKNMFAHDNEQYYNPEDRAKVFMKFVCDKNIKVIFSVKGGVDCNAMLNYVDYDLIKKNKKIFCGYSGITPLINEINARADIPTFLGPNFKAFGKNNNNLEIFKEYFFDGLPVLGNKMGEYKVIREGCATGKLIGGNIKTFLSFCLRNKNFSFKNRILILEDFAKKTGPLEVNGLLYELKDLGIFEEISGLWLGPYENTDSYDFNKSVEKLTKDKNFPIIVSNNFGHLENCGIIPIGVDLVIDTSSTIDIIKIKNKEEIYDFI